MMPVKPINLDINNLVLWSPIMSVSLEYTNDLQMGFPLHPHMKILLQNKEVTTAEGDHHSLIRKQEKTVLQKIQIQPINCNNIFL